MFILKEPYSFKTKIRYNVPQIPPQINFSGCDFYMEHAAKHLTHRKNPSGEREQGKIQINIIGFNIIRPRISKLLCFSTNLNSNETSALYNFHHCNKLQYLYKAPEDKEYHRNFVCKQLKNFLKKTANK